jgi:CRISPR-associated protein Cas2
MSQDDTTFHVIVYDISGDRLRTKVHSLLERYGTWTQFSLFECFLSAKQSVKLQGEIRALIEDAQAHIRIYMLSKDDVRRTITIGGEMPRRDDVFIT